MRATLELLLSWNLLTSWYCFIWLH